MPISDAKKRANRKYNEKAYDRIELKVPKGKKDIIKSHATQYQKESGEIGAAGYSPAGSVQGFINRAIDETIERDNNKGNAYGVPTVNISSQEEKKIAFAALDGILAGHDIDLDKMREERILAK